MRHTLYMIWFALVSPIIAVVYLIVRFALELAKRRQATKRRFTTRQFERDWAIGHSERVWTVSNVGQRTFPASERYKP